MLKIHNPTGTLWRGFEAPEKPDHACEQLSDHDCPMCAGYNQALSEAAKNSLPVLNQEIVAFADVYSILPIPGKYYDWPGTYKIVTEYYCTEPGCKIPNRCLQQGKPTLCGQESKNGYVLTPPAPVKEEPHIKVKGQGYHINKWSAPVEEHPKLTAARSKLHVVQFIYDRLVNFHGENPNYDYMIHFREFINNLKPTE